MTPGVVINGNDILVNRPSSNAPLRLTGGGDTSFESQDDVNMNFPSTSSPSFESREIISNMDCHGSGSFDDELVLPAGEMIMNDMPWDDTMLSDTSSSTPYPQNISTPEESSNESTSSTLAELEPMADHSIPPLANLNPLADPFIRVGTMGPFFSIYTEHPLKSCEI